MHWFGKYGIINVFRFEVWTGFRETLVRIAGVQGTTRPSIERKLTIVMAADNGVIAEGESVGLSCDNPGCGKYASPQGWLIALMSEKAGSDFLVADME